MSYLKRLFTVAFFTLTLVAAFNWLIDPFGMHWSPKIEGLNSLKPEAGKRSRITKIFQSNSIAPTLLIVGNSRVEMGLSPKHPALARERVYNLGLPGSSLAMQLDYAKSTINNVESVKKVWVSLDYLDFLLTPRSINAIEAGEFPDTTSYRHRLSQNRSFVNNLKRYGEVSSMLFSIDGLIASIKTIALQNSDTNSIDEYGFNSAKGYLSIIKNEGIHPLFKQKLEEIERRLDYKNLLLTLPEQEYSPNFDLLGDFIAFVQSKNIEVEFFVNPYHRSYISMIRQQGYESSFNTWRQKLGKYLFNFNYQVLDFNENNPYVNELVPKTNQFTKLEWFWEPAHYTEKLGGLMIEKLTSSSKGTIGAPIVSEDLSKLTVSKAPNNT